MKRFVWKICIVVIVVVIALSALSIRYTSISRRNIWYTDKFMRMGSNILVSDVGSSHADFGYCYENVKDFECFNFGLFSQRFSYDIRVLRQYQDHLADGGVMLITVSYFSFYIKQEREDILFASINPRYHRILSPWNVQQFCLRDAFVHRYFPILSAADSVGSLYQALTDPGTDQKELDWNHVASDLNVVEGDGLDAYEQHFDNYQGGAGRSEKEIDALYDIIALCKKQNITPVLVQTPYLAEYRKHFPADFLEAHAGEIRAVQAQTGVDYRDYSDDPRFDGRYDLFINSDHLNKTGAKVFTEIVMEEIVLPILREKGKIGG